MTSTASESYNDKDHAAEQAHLSEVYAKIQALHDAVVEDLEVNQKIARQDLIDMSEEIRPDFGGADEAMETLAAIETLNAVIDAYNQRHDFALDRLRRTLLLLIQPYFAKVVLRMAEGKPAREIYLGAAGVTDEAHRPLVVDWRSPIAETYYNQDSGMTSFSVDGRVREVELLGRRQYDIERDVLKTFFDTTVAIEDPLLLQALTSQHSEQLRAITATIQREQNEVVRHDDVPALLVNGIAGSGKTSVLLQRIAYLFYQQREQLEPQQVRLFTPNAVFGHYIDAVLPSLGEANPHIHTWKRFMAELGLGERSDGRMTDPARLRLLEQAVPKLQLGAEDFKPIRREGQTLLTGTQIKTSINKFPRAGMGPRRIALAMDELHEKLDRKLERLAADEELREEMLGLDIEEQIRLIGSPVSATDEAEISECARRYVRARFADAHQDIDDALWLRIDRIGMAILNSENLNAAEWLYLKSLLCGSYANDTRYVMIDEVQDYTEAQLMVIARYFSGAHVLMLGDEHQAIYAESASFERMREILCSTHGSVDECKLLTSYRSSPEISELFWQVLDKDAGQTISSVRTGGITPHIVEGPQQADAYLGLLQEEVSAAQAQGGLCAVVVENADRAGWLERKLGSTLPRLKENEKLPKEGVVLLDLPLAKGLEFDHVIVADAQAEVYGSDELSRRRLYTAISRAMHRVSVLSQGPLTPLVSRNA